MLGEDELKRGEATLKPLRTQDDQQQVALERLVDWLNDWLKHAAPETAGAC